MKEQYKCERKDDTILYKIGLFSQVNQVTIKTLRYYDNVGLLKPAHVDEHNGYRYYTSAQLPVLHHILALRQMGFTLEEIKEVQDGMSEEKMLLKKKSELIRKIADDTMKLSEVESYLIQKDNEGDYHIILKELPEIMVASMRTVIPDYSALFDAASVKDAEMKRLGCVYTVPQYCFDIYHDGEYKEHDIDVEICDVVTEKKKDSDIIKFKTMGKVETAACVLHKGSYKELPKAYAAVLKWIEENEFQMVDNPRESYIDGVWNKKFEEDWLTEIQVPVKRIQL